MRKHWIAEMEEGLAGIEAEAETARKALFDRIKKSEAATSGIETSKGRLSDAQAKAVGVLLQIVDIKHGKITAFDEAVGTLAGVKGTSIKDTRLGWNNAAKTGVARRYRKDRT